MFDHDYTAADARADALADARADAAHEARMDTLRADETWSRYDEVIDALTRRGHHKFAGKLRDVQERMEDDILDAAADEALYHADPYKYHGVSRSDFC